MVVVVVIVVVMVVVYNSSRVGGAGGVGGCGAPASAAAAAARRICFRRRGFGYFQLVMKLTRRIAINAEGKTYPDTPRGGWWWWERGRSGRQRA